MLICEFSMREGSWATGDLTYRKCVSDYIRGGAKEFKNTALVIIEICIGSAEIVFRSSCPYLSI